MGAALNREDYHEIAETVDDEVIDEPESAEERVWNLALRHAARVIRRAGASAPWRDVQPVRASSAPDERSEEASR